MSFISAASWGAVPPARAGEVMLANEPHSGECTN